MTTRRTAHVALRPGRGTITVDGTELRGVVACEIRGHVQEVPTMVVALALHEIEVDGQMSISVPPNTAASLVALGWTPPPGQEVPNAVAHR
ncbi:hypothetical protein RMN57_13200 [Kitasatospora sp. CM 4170]|uniref:Uncharacterized protein n=1 Tax=Kitasatospora aburaviensis TaxID=67265 RepID=A0ABW1ERQ6_9ACTN|nr:hypothetical protein [Kitasatospora sp. CM 4170]WNM45611.1 hypothetical protein RMN57_13200 [Kitasatospora sp. CM 4170]